MWEPKNCRFPSAKKMQNVNDKLFYTAAYLFVDYIFLKIKQKPSFPYKSCKNQTQTTPSHTHTDIQINKTKQKETMRKTLILFSAQNYTKYLQTPPRCMTHPHRHTKLLKRRIWMYFINVFCLYTWKNTIQRRTITQC